ncbi:MAG: addiction module toxin RelE [Aurantimonas endophytica]|uniref:addiction module toxin RelE n=1 Tax=Aurantimonas endophytica TaxID=1522175 RepID=UPI003002F7E3
MHSVVETHSFKAAASDLNLGEDEVHRMLCHYSSEPKSGDLIVGTGGARKTRFAGRGKGKSSAFRVISYYGGEDVPIFLLDIYAKGERISLTAKEKAELKKILDTIAPSWRESVSQKVEELRRSESA